MEEKIKNPLVKVRPVEWVEHKNYSDLVAIERYPNFYVNLLSGKITYKKGKIIIRTRKTNIREAQRLVEDELKARSTGKTKEEIKKDRLGISTQTWGDIWTNELMPLKKADRFEATQKTYNSNWKYGIEPFWGKKTTLELNSKTISQYKVWYLNKYSEDGRLFEKTFVHFKMLLTFALERKYITELPPNLNDLQDLGATIKKRKKYKKAGRVATADELKALEEAADKIKNSPYGGDGPAQKAMFAARSKAAFALASTMGLRKMEVGILFKDRVNWPKKEIEVWSKNKHWRKVPMSPFAEKALREQFKYNKNSQYVFPMATDPNRHISSQVLDHGWDAMKKLAGIENRLRFHDLRHTFATKTAEDNWPPIIACRVLDMSLKIYEKVYCKPSDEKIAEFMRRSFE